MYVCAYVCMYVCVCVCMKLDAVAFEDGAEQPPASAERQEEGTPQQPRLEALICICLQHVVIFTRHYPLVTKLPSCVTGGQRERETKDFVGFHSSLAGGGEGRCTERCREL